jgi:alpha/beta superfamily hydrolase
LTTPEHRVEILSEGLRLEGMLREGDGALSAVVMHPHPQYGGDMDNHVVLTLCDALRRAGASSLRFNFRGTGRSEGEHDGGRGETDDAKAALAFMRERLPDVPMVLAGYSFGAAVATAAVATAAVAARATSVDLAALILVSPPLGMVPLPAIPSTLNTLIVTGSRDTIAPAEPMRALASDCIQVAVVEGADHGWWPGVEDLSRAVTMFVRGLGLPPDA